MSAVSQRNGVNPALSAGAMSASSGAAAQSGCSGSGILHAAPPALGAVVTSGCALRRLGSRCVVAQRSISRNAPKSREFREARLRRGLSVAELAGRLGKSVRTVAGWEYSSGVGPSAEDLIACAKVLNAPEIRAWYAAAPEVLRG